MSDAERNFIERSNEARRIIQQAFRSVRVITLPSIHPDAWERKIRFDEACDDFKVAAERLRAVMADMMQNPMTFAGSPVTGALLVAQIKAIVSAVNDNSSAISPPAILDGIHAEM